MLKDLDMLVHYQISGSLSDKLMESNGIAAEVPVGINLIAYGMTVKEETSGTGTDEFYPRIGGADKTDLQVDLESGETNKSVCFATGVYISAGSTLGVYCDADGLTAGEDGSAVVHCLIRDV